MSIWPFKIGQYDFVQEASIHFDSIDDYNDEGPAYFTVIRSWPICAKENSDHADAFGLVPDTKFIPSKEHQIEGLVVRPADPSEHLGSEEKLFCRRIGVARLMSETFVDALSHVAELRIVLL